MNVTCVRSCDMGTKMNSVVAPAKEKDPSPPVLIIGHRGAMGHAPENTRASFEAGLRLGAEAVECDVHLSKDGQPVVIHDETVDRTTNGRGLVRKKIWADLQRLDAGSWFGRGFAREKLWRLDDLFDWAKSRRTKTGALLQVVVELKTNSGNARSLVQQTVAVLKKRGMVGRVILISFNPKAMTQAKVSCPRLRTGLLLRTIPQDLPRRMALSRAEWVFPRFTLLTDRFTREARQRGWFVGTWTVNERLDLKRVLRLRVNAIASNFPERLVRLRSS